MGETGKTLETVAPERRRGGTGDRDAFLYLAFRCERPLAPGSRHALRDLAEVSIGRNAEPTWSRRAEQGKTSLVLGVDDPWMSVAHARLRHSSEGWTIEDAGSRNGTRVNGAARSSAPLADGDLVELGHTLFLYREVPAASGAAGEPDVDGAALAAPAAGLETLSASQEAQFSRLERIAPSQVAVVLAGESGSGKELAARAIHRLSRRPGAFVAVNCGGIPATLIETEMFGHRKGAFTGASEDRQGLLRSADRGTLFLDEVADLPATGQAALLRALQESEVVPVGSTRPVAVDLRLLAATHFDLKARVQQGTFRADLYARLSGLTVKLLPLRDRLEDLGLLVASILRRVAGERAGRISFAVDAGRLLLRYGWPLNIRELERALGAAAALADQDRIEPEHLPEELSATPEASPTAPTAPQLSADDARRRDEIVTLLREKGGNVTAVARSLGKARMQVQRWIKRYRIDAESYRR